VDLLDIKRRIARALVESIFRRAGFTVTPVGPREPAGWPARLGREDLGPDFSIRRGQDPAVAGGAARLVEVRYRREVSQYLALEDQRGVQSVFAHAKRQWPDLMFVFVTDRPETGRSGFQVLDLAHWRLGEPVAALDLFAHPGLDVYRRNVEEHEELARRIFALLA